MARRDRDIAAGDGNAPWPGRRLALQQPLPELFPAVVARGTSRHVTMAVAAAVGAVRRDRRVVDLRDWLAGRWCPRRRHCWPVDGVLAVRGATWAGGAFL